MPIRRFEWGGGGNVGVTVAPSYRHHDNGGWLVFSDLAGWAYLPDYMVRSVDHNPTR